MKWVVQSNVYQEESYGSLLDAIRERGLPLTTVKVIPFGGGMESTEGDIPRDGECAIVMGSYSLSREALRRGWTPGSFLKNLDFVNQRMEWGERMLNYDAFISRFDSIPFQREPFFLRPVHDTKAFTGFVCDWGYYQEWLESIQRLPAGSLEGGLLDVLTPVMVCPRWDIHSETRTWVVGGRVVTSSGYKRGTIKRYTRPESVPRHVTDFAQETADLWCPNDAFVLDVAETSKGMRIVEVNNLNSAGFYLGDMGSLVQSLEELHVG